MHNIITSYLLLTLHFLSCPSLNSTGSTKSNAVYNHTNRSIELLDGEISPFTQGPSIVIWYDGQIISQGQNRYNYSVIKVWDDPINNPSICKTITNYHQFSELSNYLNQQPSTCSNTLNVKEIKSGSITIQDLQENKSWHLPGTSPIIHPKSPSCIVYRGLVEDCTNATCLDWENLIFEKSEIKSTYSAIVFHNPFTGNETDIQLIPEQDDPKIISSFSLKSDGSLIAYSIENGSIIVQTPPGLPQ